MRLVNAIKTWAGEVVAGWNRFWFTPIDPATLGVIRIAAGAMLFYTHLVWSLGLTDFFGEHSWLPREAEDLLQQGTWSWSYLWWLNSPAALWAAHIAALIVFAMLTVGLLTRVASLLALVATLAYIGRAQGALFGLDQINSMLALYLAIGPCGDAFSVDRWLARRKAGKPLPVRFSWTANLAIRLIQVHMCIIYLFAGTAKLTGPAWWDGTAMWMALGNLEYQSMDMTWMANWPRMINALTHITVYWEVFYSALIWPRLTRPVMLVLAIPLHLGIAICLGMVTFGLVMLIGNLAFVSPALVRALLPSRSTEQGRGGDASSSNATARPSRPTAQSSGQKR